MPTIREYLVSLGAEVDNKSFSKFNAALKGAGVTAAKFGAGMAALMTMVAKTSISLDKTTQAYDAMAKKQHKSIELIRAQETALKILGKTQKEVDADKELKAQYKELKALGKEMTFPTVAAGEKTLRGFLQDFDKFRMVSTYAINWVNHEFLAKIAAPLGETRKGLQEFTERLKKNMPQIADRVSQVFSNMFRLALAGVNAFGKLLEKIEKLPPAFKLVGAAILAAFGLSKFGPVLLLIGGITTILALLDDYQTWLRGGNAALGEFWAAMKDGSGVEYMKAKLGELPAKIKQINDEITEFLSGFFTKGEKVANKMLKGIAEHDWSGDGQFIGKFFGDLVTNMLNFLNENLSNGTTFFASVGEVAGKLLVGLSEALSSAMVTFPWAETLSGLLTGADNILTIVGGLLFGGEGSDGTKYDGLVKNFKTVARNLISGIAVAFHQLNPSDVSDDIAKVVNHVFELIGKFFTPESGTDTDKLLEHVTGTAFEIGEKILNIIGETFATIDLNTAGETIGNAFNHIMERVINWLGVVSINLPFFTNTAKENMKKVATGILTFLGSAFDTVRLTDVQTIITKFFGIITGFIHQVLQKDPKGESILSDAFSVMGNVALGLVEAVLGGIGSIEFDKVGADVGSFVERVFEFIAEIFGKKTDEKGNTTTLADRVAKLPGLLTTIAQGMINGIASAFSLNGANGLHLEKVSDSVSEIIEGIFGLIGQVFSKENVNGAADVLANLVSVGGQVASGLISGIANMFVGDKAPNLAQVTEPIKNILGGVFRLIGQVFSKENIAGASEVLSSLVSVGGEVAKGLIGSIASMFTGDKAPELSEVTAPIKNIMSGLFKLIGDVFTKENATTLGDIIGSVADIGMTLGIGIINSIGDLFGNGGDIPLDKVAGSIGSFISTIFKKISEYAGKLLEKDESGQTFGDRLGTTFTGVANALVKGIGDAMTTLTSSGVGENLGTGLNTLFQIIASLFTPANIGSLTGVALSIGDTAVNIVGGIVREIGTAFGQIEAKDIGDKIGAGIGSFFGKISEWLGSQISSGEDGGLSLIGDIGNTVYTVAEKIVTMLGAGIESLASTGALKSFGTNLAKFLENAIKNFAKDVQDGKIKVDEIATGIGNVIGGAIKLSTDFLSSFITECYSWLSGGGAQQLVDLGQAILDGILSGLTNIYDAIMTKIFGEDYTNARDEFKAYQEHEKEVREIMEETGASRQEVEASLAAESRPESTNVVTELPSGKKMTYNEVYQNMINDSSFFAQNGMLPGWYSKVESNLYAKYNKLMNEAKTDDDFNKYDTLASNILARRYGFSGYDEFEHGMKSYGGNTEIIIDNTKALQNIAAVQTAMDNIHDKTVNLNVNKETENALGGRFSTATRGVFGEDGTEYIIPITKPSRAKALILQMLQEMGAGANDILSEWGATGGGGGMGGPGMGWSSQPAAMYPQAGGNVKSNSDNNVNVPTTINVYGSGDALMTGQAAARASQSNVLRAVRGVVGA